MWNVSHLRARDTLRTQVETLPSFPSNAHHVPVDATHGTKHGLWVDDWESANLTSVTGVNTPVWAHNPREYAVVLVGII